MLNKVLWKNKSRWQTTGASIGIFIGLFLLLFALQVYLDVQILTKGAKDNNFLVINKLFEKNYGKPLTFSQEEFNEIRQQPFFNQVDAFESNDYKVSLSSQTMGFRTLLFFQALPQEFLDVDSVLFQWKPGDKIPIVLSSDYLALYNFGFAPSQGLPKFSANTISLVDFKIAVSGNGQQEIFDGYVCGFTPNVNSILVPKSFMRYANQKFGESSKTKLPTQLIASTDNPYSVGLEKFLAEKNYEISRGGLIGGELKTTLFMLVFLLVAIGLTIVGLAMLVFILNFQVLIAQASQDIQLLIQLGYKDQQIAKILAKNLLKLFGIVVVAVFALLVPIKYLLSSLITEQGYHLSFSLHPIVWFVGLLFCILFIWINISSIRKNVQNLA
ncbi:FtsX-like permease family protein [Aureispira anguillae]|uniref:FtsX-like permease family protein n=1 Tax=Aureispira anguillae TaxID=2864201 RepID=A0A916DPZ8_9BACT|nr:FtsX-like permease family protein [Aureispira anguillae]BDS09805.1 hypothetical protein AsAng_0005100 [Aureispira anguillae]